MKVELKPDISRSKFVARFNVVKIVRALSYGGGDMFCKFNSTIRQSKMLNLVSTISLLVLLLLYSFPAEAQPGKTDFTVFLFADNQFTEEHGFSIAEQARAVDRVINPVARRPAILNMFSLAVLERVIKLGSKFTLDADLFIHLGDAINNGCKTEFESFLSVMNQEGRQDRIPWFMAPGNHDSFFLGISHPVKEDRTFLTSSLDDRKYWQSLCQNMRTYNTGSLSRIDNTDLYPPNALTKKRFINAYLDNLIFFSNSGSVIWSDFATDAYVRPDEIEASQITCVDKPDIQYLHRMCWKQAASDREWSGFIVQEIRFPDRSAPGKFVSIILLDTNDFSSPPSMISHKFGGAGRHASIGKSQLSIIEKWLRQNKADGVTSILAAHQHFDALKRRGANVISSLSIFSNNFLSNSGIRVPEVLSEAALKILDWKREELFDTYFSAHTHKSFEKKHPISGTEQTMQEINIGSLVDHPVEYYILKFGQSSKELANSFKCQRRPFAPETKEETEKRADAICSSTQTGKAYFDCNNRDENGRRFREEVQRALYSRIQLPDKYSSEIRGQNSHLSALGRELIAYNSMFADLELDGKAEPICFRHYVEICDAPCQIQNGNKPCSSDQLKELREKQSKYCRTLNEINLNCSTDIVFNPPHKRRNPFNRHEFARTNGRVLDSAAAVREQIHDYLSLVFSASRDKKICQNTESASKFDTLCVGPDVMEIMLARFLEAVEIFVKRNQDKFIGTHSKNHALCYALLGSDFDVQRRFGFNPLDD